MAIPMPDTDARTTADASTARLGAEACPETPGNGLRRIRIVPPSVPWRAGLRWFTAEFLVVVAGILAALALNAWWQGRQDAGREKDYLALLSRDLRQMDGNLRELRAFEDAQVRDGLRAYRIISAPSRSPAEQLEVSRIVSLLGTRRTMVAVDAAYEDLTSTGNLRLIHDHVLRDRIVNFYQTTKRELMIHNRNNAFFVDDQFVGKLMGGGLFQHRQSRLVLDQRPSAGLAGGYIESQDRIWSLPPEGPEWAAFKSLLVQRVDIATAAVDRAERLRREVRALGQAVDAARKS